MVERVSPENYFMYPMQDENKFKCGVILGAVLVLIGVVVGGIMVYMAGRKC